MRYTRNLLLTSEDQTIVTTPFLLDMLDSALIENIQNGNIQAAYGVLDLSVNLALSMEENQLSAIEGKKILTKVKKAMDKGNVANAKQQMIEFALR